MIRKHPNLLKQVALLMAVAILSMSFKMRANEGVILTSGTIVPLETVSMIQSDLVIIGQIIDFRVTQDVVVDGKKVIAGGSIAKGQVMRAQRAKGLGKEGFVEIHVKSVTAVDGQEVFLTGGNVYQEGEDQQTLSIVLGVLVCILFLTMKGKNAQVPPGYSVNSNVASNTTIDI